MTKEQPRQDVDEVILNFFAGRLLSPKELSRGCQPEKMSRATYFRHKKKLLDQLRIEQIERIDEDGKIVKLLKQVTPRELADSRDIEEFLEEIENSDEVTSWRGIRDLGRLCDNYRVAYYFSPQISARFNTKEEVESFFERKLLHGTRDRRLQFLLLLHAMLGLEIDGSPWKRNLLQCCCKPIETLAWEESDSEIRAWSIKVLTLISDEWLLDEKALFDLGYFILKQKMHDQDFNRLIESVKTLLIRRKSAVEKRHEIRRNLNKLGAIDPVWKKRVEMILA